MSNNDQQQQQQPAQQQGQMPAANMAAFGYPPGTSQEALMQMLQGGGGGGQQYDANGQPIPGGQGMPQNSMMMGQGGYGMGMFDPSQMQQMQQMAGFGGFPMQGGFAMDPSGGMNMFFPGMQQQPQQGAAGAGGDMTQAQTNTMNSSAALAQASGAMNPQQAAAMQQAGMGGQGMMMGDPGMLLRQMMQQQGNFFGGQQPGQQAQMFGLGAGLSGAAGITAASYLNMAQQAGVGTGAADLQASMPGSMMVGAGGAAILNPFAPTGKKIKKIKNKNKPKRPLSGTSLVMVCLSSIH